MSTVECPKCGNEYKSIGNHWAYNDHRPELTTKQKDIIRGLLMGDGYINHNRTNVDIAITSINKNYLEYLSELFGILSCEVRLRMTAEESAAECRKNGLSPNADASNYSDKYRLQLRRGDHLNQFEHWYDEDKNKTLPKEIQLTPTVLKHWYVGDGHISGSSLNITICNEANNTDKIDYIFSNSNLPKPDNYVTHEQDYNSNTFCRLTFNKDKSEYLYEYMEDPLPGYEYKWRGCESNTHAD